MPGKSITKATETDIPSLLHFAKENFIITYAHMNTRENMENYLLQCFTPESFSREFNHPDSSFFLLKDGQEIIGYYKMNLNDAQTERHYPNSAEIERIYVATGHKGKGLGKHMILHACETAQLANARYIWLGVWEKNPAAIAFYQKMGFEQIDTHMFQLGDDAQTDIIMKLNL